LWTFVGRVRRRAPCAGSSGRWVERALGRAGTGPGIPGDWLGQMAAMAAAIHDASVSAPAIERWIDPARLTVAATSGWPDVWRAAIEVLQLPHEPRSPRFIHRDFQHFNLLWARGRLTEPLTGALQLPGRRRSTWALPTQPRRALLSGLGRAVPPGLPGGDRPQHRPVVGSARPRFLRRRMAAVHSDPGRRSCSGRYRRHDSTGRRPSGVGAPPTPLLTSWIDPERLVTGFLWLSDRVGDSEPRLRIRGSAPDPAWPC